MSDFELNQSINILESLPSDLLKKGENKPILLYNGCSRSATGFKDSFVEGNLVQIWHPHLTGGIGASCEATHERTFKYEVINN